MADLSALLTASKDLTSHLYRPDLPSVALSLDQVEAQSRRLVSRQPGSSNDADRASVVLLFPLINVLISCLQKLFTCSGARRCIRAVRQHCTSQYFNNILATPTFAGHGRHRLSATWTRTDVDIHN